MAQGDLTPDQVTALIGPNPAAPPKPPNLLPMTSTEVAAMGTSGTAVNVPPTIGDTRRRQQALGEQPGVTFHEEGLPAWTDLMARSQANQEEQIKYLARRFGAENVRLNEYNEPVVRIKDPDTGKMEDYPLNPRQLTVRSLSGLARFAPDIAGGIAAYALGGPGGVVKKSVQSSLGAEAGGALREIVAGAGSRLVAQGPAAMTETPVKAPILQHLEQVPVDILLDLGLAGGIKAGQAIGGIGLPRFLGGQGIRIPNPVGGTILTQPARPEFTKTGVEAARELQSLTGIDPRLRGSETTGIPIHAMIEQYLERSPAGAAPQIAAGEAREKASKAIQNWMVDPSTLATDEVVGRRGLAALKRTVEPYEAEVGLAKFAQEAEEKGMARLAESQLATATKKARTAITTTQTADIMAAMNLATIPDKGVNLAPIGEALTSKAVDMRDAAKAQFDALYAQFRAHPMANEPIIPGAGLKAEIDQLRARLPAVTKEVEQPLEGGLVDISGNLLAKKETVRVPIRTPIRPRLDELSKKLAGGTVSINDLKEIRTDVGNAMTYGEPFAGYKEGRLKALYRALSQSIDDGLKQINDPQLTQLWKTASDTYEKNVAAFENKDVARLFKEADQAGSIGPTAFTKKAMIDPDLYASLGKFYGAKSTEMDLLRETIKNKTISDALAPDGLVDGAQLTRLLKTIKDERPSIFEDVFGGKGNDLLKAANQLGTWQQKVPMEEIAKMLGPGASKGSPSVKLIGLQAAQRRLDQEYQNEVIAKFLKGGGTAADLHPDRFVASIREAKLSDVRDVMARLEREDPGVAEQVRRKAVQQLLVESRRTATSTDAMAKTLGEPGELISATGLQNALGRGDQLEKYKSLLGPLFDPLILFTRQELLGQQRREVAGSVGLLVPGSAVNALKRALTPWEGHEKGKGMLLELSGLARDKVFSIAISNPAIQRWLMSPYALKDASNAIKIAIMSEPFIKGMMEEFRDKNALSQVMSTLKVGVGTAAEPAGTGPQGGDLTPEQVQRMIGAPK